MPAPSKYPPLPPLPRQGRESRPRSNLRGDLSNAATIAWFCLLILPAFALRQLSDTVDWRFLCGGFVVISLVTWQIYGNDKRKAQTGAWRTPEATLHLAELAGGWPAAFLAQRMFRHKIAKMRFQFFYWAIVFLHQFVAFDFLRGWQFSQGALRAFRQLGSW